MSATLTHYLVVQMDPRPRSRWKHSLHAGPRRGHHAVRGVDWIGPSIVMQSLQENLALKEDAGALAHRPLAERGYSNVDCSSSPQAALHVYRVGISHCDLRFAVGGADAHRHLPKHQHSCRQRRLDLFRAAPESTVRLRYL